MSDIARSLHYVWFGGRPKPASMEAVIAGWKRLMPHYRIIEWNESNVDLTAHPWMKRMHDEGRYAFASDYARFMILWEHGGVYLDTDVVMKKSIEPFLQERCLWAFELDSFLSTCIIATVPRHPLIRALLDEYDRLDKPVVNNAIVTEYFLRNYPEFRLNNKDQRVGDDVRILPKEYFVVPSFSKQKNYAVHSANNQWKPERGRWRMGRILRPLIGEVLFYKLVNLRMTLTSVYPAMDRARRRPIGQDRLTKVR
jgi:hypothetical protein